jgi:hypothetical protein
MNMHLNREHDESIHRDTGNPQVGQPGYVGNNVPLHRRPLNNDGILFTTPAESSIKLAELFSS